MKRNVCEQKLRSTCRKMAKCGLTSLHRCKTRRAGLDECNGCNLVARVNERWKMIDRKPHRKCRRCGRFLPLDKFYPKKIKKKDGTVFETTETVCKVCRSEMYYEKVNSLKNKKKATKKRLDEICFAQKRIKNK